MTSSFLRRGHPLRRRLLKSLAIAATLYLGLWHGLPRLVPLPSELDKKVEASPELLARDGTVLSSLTRPDLYRHRPVSLKEIPEDLILATLAAEDKRFYQHGGIDLLANLRAVKDNLNEGEVVSGASTLTQQLIKISSGYPPRTYRNKLVEALQARHLESRWSKEDILEAYFNRLDYGSHRQGPAAAARYYFQRPLDQLSLAQCALLAGIPQAPTRHNPLRNPQFALERRNWVLDRMHQVHDLDSDRIARAKAEPLILRPMAEKSLAPHLADLFRCSGPQPSGPLTTTIDPELQAFAESCIEQELSRLREHEVNHAGLLLVHNPSGEILALVGSGNYQSDRGGQLNAVTTPRSPGSTLKPLLYAYAFDQGLSWPGHILPDIPDSFVSADGLDAPKNYDLRHHGPVSVRYALANSLNIAALHQLNQVGGPAPWMQFLDQLGFEFQHRPRHYGLGLAIGNAEVPMLQLAQAYQALANGGKWLPLSLQQSEAATKPTEGLPHISASSAFLIADILSDAQARSPAFGRHSSLNLPFRCAVKTGTSSDFRDNWCVGYTPTHTLVVWVGNFDNTPMRGMTGLTGAGPIFNRIMRHLGPGDIAWPAAPTELCQVAIDPRLGKRHLIPPKDKRSYRNEWAFANNPPLPLLKSDLSEDGRARLDPRYATWLATAPPEMRARFCLSHERAPTDPPMITSPLDGSRFLLDPDLPGGSHTLPLRGNRPDIQWSSPSLEITPEASLILAPGTHQVHATLPGGEELRVEIQIQQL